MELTRAAWNKYVRQLGEIDQRAGQMMADYIKQVGTADTQRLIWFAKALVDKYGAASSALAARFYDEMAQAAGLTLPAAEPAEVSSYGEVAKAVNGTRNSIANTRNAVSRMVKQAGADTILKNAKRDGAEFAWVPNGDSCAFCITLASRGWQKASKAAIKGNHAEHIHANCDCNYCIRFNSRTNVEGYDPDSYLEMYESAEGGTPRDKINAMRRQIRQGNREKVNRQKREAYAAKHANFMGRPRNFADKGGIISVKAYQVKGHDEIFTQTNSTDAQNTIELIAKTKGQLPQLQSVQEIVVMKDFPGIAAYDHVDKRLYVNEQLTNASYIAQEVADGYFVAENAEDVLRHEMHHKDHWDLVDDRALTTDKSRDIVKQEIEADLRSYVQRQLSVDPFYVQKHVSRNASDSLKKTNSLNELVAETMLQMDKGIGSDEELLRLVGDMFYGND